MLFAVDGLKSCCVKLLLYDSWKHRCNLPLMDPTNSHSGPYSDSRIGRAYRPQNNFRPGLLYSSAVPKANVRCRGQSGHSSAETPQYLPCTAVATADPDDNVCPTRCFLHSSAILMTSSDDRTMALVSKTSVGAKNISSTKKSTLRV